MLHFPELTTGLLHVQFFVNSVAVLNTWFRSLSNPWLQFPNNSKIQGQLGSNIAEELIHVSLQFHSREFTCFLLSVYTMKLEYRTNSMLQLINRI